jgi:tRNA 2-thiouridine synthesizing protein C
MKKILFILNKPPHSGAYAQETLDIVMTVAAFDQAVSILLLDDAAFQLKAQQHPDNANLKDITAIFNALPLYNIHSIYAETESLRELGLTSQCLAETVTEIPRNKVGEFLNTFDLVINA